MDRFGAVADASCFEGCLSFLEALLAQDDFLYDFRKTILRPAKPAAEHVDDTLREGGGIRLQIHDVCWADAFAEAEQSHVTDHLARGRHLHDVAEKFIHLGVSPGDFWPSMRNPHARGLLLQVGVLAAGHLMNIHLG